MDVRFFLIDFENVQVQDLGSLTPGTCRIKIFLGQNQSKLPLELVKALRPFGTDADYIQITGSGPNALDFHIAFYIGRFSSEQADAAFTIISKDTGFDPLVKHLNGLQINCKRLDELPGTPGTSKPAPKVLVAKTAIKTVAKAKPAANVIVPFAPVLKEKSDPSKSPSASTRVAEVVKRLGGMKTAKPARLATLQSSISSWFKPALDEKATASIVQSLKDQKKISVAGAKVSYLLG